MRKFIPAVLSCLTITIGLSACSSGETEATMGKTLTQAALGAVKARASSAKTPDPGAQASGLLEAIQSADGPVLLVSVPARDSLAAITPLSQNGSVTTWASQDGLTLSTRGGLVVATRGFGDDLLSVSTAETQTAIAAGGGQYNKTISLFAIGEAPSRKQLFTCTLRESGLEALQILAQSVRAQRYDEECRAPGANFNNAYWVAGGKIVQSSQWVSPTIKSLAIQAVK